MVRSKLLLSRALSTVTLVVRRGPTALVCAILVVSCATSPHRVSRDRNVGIACSRAEEECDPPTSGALIGAAIGGIPAILTLVNPDGTEADGIALYAGLIGAIVGFWVGIGIDEAHCHPPE